MIGAFRKRSGDEPLTASAALFIDLAGARPDPARTAEDRRRDFRAVLLGTPAGRRVLYEILAWAHVFASIFVPGDSHATHWREGGRDVGLRILAALATDDADASASVAAGTGAEDGEVRP